MTGDTGNDAAQKRYAYEWYVVLICMLAYIFSFVDRQILALMIEPIKRDLQLSDCLLYTSFDISDQVRDFEIDDIDAAIRFGAGRYPGARADRLFATTLAPIASPALLASGPPIASPRDLARFPLSHVDCVADGMVWPDWKMWLAAAGVADVDASRSLAFPDSSHVAQAALDGSAVGLLEPAMVAADLASGRLVRLFDIDVGMAPDFAYYLVYPLGLSLIHI